MQPGYFFATVTAVTAILVIAMLLMFQWWKKLMIQFLKSLETATNLAASKNLETFQRLQATTNLNQNPLNPSGDVEILHPLNDEAIAHQIAENLKAQGMDPNRAYANTDDEWIADFGGPDAFR